MRLSNRNQIPKYSFFLTFIYIFLILGTIGFFVNRYVFHAVNNIVGSLMIIFPLLLLLLMIIRGRQIFEYDSDGEALNFRNKNLIPFLHSHEAKDEFPKYKLISYEVVNAIFFKKLFIKISSKKSTSTILKYDISYLSNKNIKDLKMSLNKVIKANHEAKREGKTTA